MAIAGANNLSVSIKGVKKAERFFKDQKKASEKAMNTAIKVEAFRLKKKLQSDLRKGAPGGSDLSPLSYIARRMWRNPNRKPLSKLAPAVRYRVAKQTPFTAEVGFVQPGSGSHKVSSSWRRLAKLHQEGFTQDITRRQRFFVINRGAELGTVEGGNTPFFLRKSTKKFTTPARPIIDPFWRANRKKARQNIKGNFRRKMKGQRI